MGFEEDMQDESMNEHNAQESQIQKMYHVQGEERELQNVM
jgi:hypothetical protein